MSQKRTSKIEVPGDTAAPTDTGQPEAAAVSEVAAAESAAAAPEANSLAPAVALQPASMADTAAGDQAKGLELNRQVGIVNSQLIGSDKALDWSHLTNPSALANKLNPDPEAHLPTVESIDWNKVQGDRVLTKQGWLLRP